MTVTRRSVPRRPTGLKARPQMTMTKEEFSEACGRIGLSIKEIAERLDINRTTVHAYQTGKLRVPTIIALAITMLGLEVDKEREANRRRLRRYGYSEEEQADILSVLPSGLAMALVIPRKDDGKLHGNDDDDEG